MIDETRLAYQIAELKLVVANSHGVLNDAQRVLNALLRIDRKGAAANPVDTATGLPMSDAHRLEIFQAHSDEVDRLIRASSAIALALHPDPDE